MHDIIIALVFAVMVLSPCLVASMAQGGEAEEEQPQHPSSSHAAVR